MKLGDVLKLLSDQDRLRIIKGGKDVYIGFLANIDRAEANTLTGNEEVKQLRADIELRHRQWKDKNLMPPLEPQYTAQYKFSDLEMKLYYNIVLE